LLISAFNHPLNLVAHLLGPAIQAGVPALLKPALEVQDLALWLLSTCQEEGLHPDWCELVTLPDAQLGPLVRSPKLAFLGFVGSARVGWQLRSEVAPGCRVALEHGGAAALILDQGCRWQEGIKGIVRASTYHAGQVCISTQHLFVHESIYDDVKQSLAIEFSALVIGPSEEDKTQVGPLFRESDARRVKQWIQEALDQGAKVAAKAVAPEGARFVDALVLEDVPWTVSLSCEEVFGPVLILHKIKDVREAMMAMRRLPWRFHLSLWTDNLERALHFARVAPASHVLINEATTFRVDEMPFAGHGSSGLGQGGVRGTLLEMTEEVGITFRSTDWVR
jgi:acyl-CoA reductase-like NAD-dependent aldehyde dehydrogenase